MPTLLDGKKLAETMQAEIAAGVAELAKSGGAAPGLATVLASLEPTAQVTRQLTTLMTMVTLQSVTHALETKLASTEFVVLPIFGQDGQPEYQIEIHLGRPAGLSLAGLDSALKHAQSLLTALR